MSAAARNLRRLYREVPAATGCIPGCGDCCGPVPWTVAEFAAVEADLPPLAQEIEVAGTRSWVHPGTMKCAFWTDAGCSVHARRPFMCRLFAATTDPVLSCPHGACKARSPLSAKQASALTWEYRRLPVEKAR